MEFNGLLLQDVKRGERNIINIHVEEDEKKQRERKRRRKNSRTTGEKDMRQHTVHV